MSIANALVDQSKLDEYLAAKALKLKQSIAAGGVRISTKNKVFTTPSGETNEELSVVILDQRNINIFYNTAYKAGEYKPPVCFAIGEERHDALVPVENAPKKQAASCGECPHNKWDGGRKKCGNRVRLAVAAANANSEEADIFILTITPKGLSGYKAFQDRVANKHNMPPIGVQTLVTFGPDDFPVLEFKEIKPVERDRLMMFLKLAERAQDILDREPIFD